MQNHDNKLTVVFVYGTLKKHDCRSYLMDGSIFLGGAVTDAKYQLYNLGSYPGLVETDFSAGVSVQGELYAVTDECLLRLDQEEGVADGLYERRKVQLLPPHAEVATEAYFYLLGLGDAEDIGTRWNSAQPT